jgi:hypothetical protein
MPYSEEEEEEEESMSGEAKLLSMKLPLCEIGRKSIGRKPIGRGPI